MTGAPGTSSAWERASLAAALFAVDPLAGGIALRAGPGPTREAWLGLLISLLPAGARALRMPLGIADDRLLGGLDLAATLRAGTPVAERGLLAQSDGGVLILAMAERLPEAVAARIVATIDSGEVRVERDGLTQSTPARFGLVALDEGQGDDERPPEALLDRLALRLDLDAIGHRDARRRLWDHAQVGPARDRLAAVRADDSAIETLVTVAARLGIGSIRAPLLALRVARAACALRGAAEVEEADIAVAAQLVLAPRATIIPLPESPEAADPPQPEDERDETPDAPPEAAKSPDSIAPADLEDIVLAAAAAAIPPGLLAQIAAGPAPRQKSGRAGRAGAAAPSGRRGRPIGARRGELRDGRLALVDTLRAAAPWQALRRKAAKVDEARRIVVFPSDFRIARLRERKETAAIFVVDASGSAATQRLAEVKGAIELLLADCYVRRDCVALVTFRGAKSEIVLPPTRSLARAKRVLAGLPGGGGTPLASGLDASLTLAESVRRKGQSPLLVLMTDGRANIGRDGKPGRAQAFADALAAGARVRAAGVAAIAIDTAPIAPAAAEPPTFRLGMAMNARYIKLPNGDAARVSAAVRGASTSV